RGVWDSATNGPTSVRCAAVTNGAVLRGFALSQGASRELAGPGPSQTGGGVWGSSTGALVSDCLIVSNAASSTGGGAYQATVKNCTLFGNLSVGSSASPSSGDGGGAALCTLSNCIVTANFAYRNGGGTFHSKLRNSAVTRNLALASGGGSHSDVLV